MKTTISRLCRTAIVGIALVLPCAGAQAGIVSTQDVAAQKNIAAQREKVREFMARSDVAKDLIKLGVAPDLAKKRVEALTDQEVVAIAGKIDRLPAGGRLDHTETVLLLVFLILLVIAL